MKFSIRRFSISQQILLVAVGLSIVLVVFLLSFSANQVITTKNSIKEIVNQNRSFGAVEKIDRNFYERFGDVQAFAYNKLAIEALDSGRATADAQNFINTMTSYYVLYDLMLIVDKNGKGVAVNSLDKSGVPVRTEELIGMDFSHEDWFRICMSAKGPEGGAWYSDFQVNQLVGRIYNSKGWGMGFAAPIKNDSGQIIGAWFNYASWLDVTQGIRIEIEELLKKENHDAFLLITDRNGKVIDAADESLVGTLRLDDYAIQNNEFEFSFNASKISSDNYVAGFGQAKGAYTYKGNNWKAFTFIPRDKFSFSIFFGELRTLTITIILILMAGIVTFYILSRSISQRIQKLQSSINSISQGELVSVEFSGFSDEVGQMTNSLKKLIEGLSRTSLFANEIGQGNLDSDFKALSEKDVLGLSLVTMRDNLVKIKKEDEKRQWITQGLAEFGDKLRKTSSGFNGLCDEIVIFLCNYMNANQAAIFITEEEGEENVLTLISCYAWNRKKYLNQKLHEGEGLIGQAWQEGQMIYMTKIPDDFIRITSGLGEASPNCIAIIPLKSNDEVLGVLEIASFEKFQEYQIEFLKKLSENMGATLASEKVNERTKKLLEQTQKQTEEMRSQEEEMRQNMEELSATQEELSRKEMNYLKKIEELELRLAKNAQLVG